MTYQNMTNDQLCAKLSAKYRSRFESACSNARATTENISRTRAQANAENERRAREAKTQKAASHKQIPGYASAKRSAREASYENFVSDGNYGYARARAQRVRAWVAMNAPKGDAAQQRRHYEEPRRAHVAVENNAYSESTKLTLRERWKNFVAKDASEEIEKKVKTAPVSKSLIVSVLLLTVMVMAVLFSYSSYAQVNSRVEELKAEKTVLLAERENLQRLLAVRDDIREIEDYATNVIGMVKSDYVETRYVSIADGERIEVLSTDEAAAGAPGFFSTLLSAMGGNWERVLEYID